MQRACVRREVPVIVMCDYCTTKNLDHAAPELVHVAGAEGVVFIARGGMSENEWTKVKLTLLKVLRQFKAKRAAATSSSLGGGGGELGVQVGEDMLLIKSGNTDDADELKSMLDRELGSASNVAMAKNGVGFEDADKVESFVTANTAAASPTDDPLSDLTLDVLTTMSGTSTTDPGAVEFAKSEAENAANKYVEKIKGEAYTLAKVPPDAGMLRDAAAFAITPDDAREFVDELITKAASDAEGVAGAAYDSVTTFKEALAVVERFSAKPPKPDPGAWNALINTIVDGMAAAAKMCSPCSQIDTTLLAQSAKQSGVRTEEYDGSGPDCVLQPHPLIALVEEANALAARAKTMWGYLKLMSGAVQRADVEGSLVHAGLLKQLSDGVNNQAHVNVPDLERKMQVIIRQVKEIVDRHRVIDVPLAVSMGTESCSEMRVSAVVCAKSKVRLVVMYDDSARPGDEAQLSEVWAAAHEDQASLARYRMAHAQFRAAQLRSDTSSATTIRGEIIDLQVGEIMANVRTVRHGLSNAVGLATTAVQDSVKWIEHQGYVKCLQWFDRLLSAGEAALRTALTAHVQERIADLQLHATERWDHARSKEEADLRNNCDSAKAPSDLAETAEKLKQALHRVSQIPSYDGKHSIYVKGNSVHDTVEGIRALQGLTGSLRQAHTATSAHQQLQETLCAKTTVDDHARALALPFMAKVASESTPQIAAKAGQVLEKYKNANAAFGTATAVFALFECNVAGCGDLAEKLLKLGGPKLPSGTYAPDAVAMHTSPESVTVLLRWHTATEASEAKNAVGPTKDLAVCSSSFELLESFIETQPLANAIAHVLDPGPPVDAHAQLGMHLDRAKYGLDLGIVDATTGTSTTAARRTLSPDLVSYLANAVATSFDVHAKKRGHSWTEFRYMLEQRINTAKQVLQDRVNGTCKQEPWVSNDCFRTWIRVLQRAEELSVPKFNSKDDLMKDVTTAIINGAPLKALVGWVEACATEQSARVQDMSSGMKSKVTGTWLQASVLGIFAEAAGNSDFTIMPFFINMHKCFDDTAAMCAEADEGAPDINTEVASRTALAKGVDEALAPLPSEWPDTEIVTRAVWREYWIAPAGAIDEWSAKKDPASPAVAPAFFKHVFPHMGTNTAQHVMYTELVEKLGNAPPSVYMYAFLQARKWLGSQGYTTTMGGGARGATGSGRGGMGGAGAGALPSVFEPSAVPIAALPSAPEAEGHYVFGQIAGAGAGPSASEAALPSEFEPIAGPGAVAAGALAEESARLREADAEPSASGGGGRSSQRAAAAPRARRPTLHAGPKGDLGGAVRRAVTLLVLENARMSAATCCDRILAGKFAKQTRRADSAVIAAEHDRAALCHLAKELCRALCR
jgi:hypothetical protein